MLQISPCDSTVLLRLNPLSTAGSRIIGSGSVKGLLIWHYVSLISLNFRFFFALFEQIKDHKFIFIVEKHD